MKTRIHICALLLAALAASLFAGCKPTEKNYKAAYDVALKKRQQESGDATDRSEGHRLITDDGARTIGAAGREWHYSVINLSPTDGASTVKGKSPGTRTDKPAAPDAVAETRLTKSDDENKWVVAVSRYRMPTNARSQVADLLSQGFSGALVMKDASDRYYAVAGRFATLEEAGRCALRLTAKLAATAFVGFDGEPLLIENPLR